MEERIQGVDFPEAGKMCKPRGIQRSARELPDSSGCEMAFPFHRRANGGTEREVSCPRSHS